MNFIKSFKEKLQTLNPDEFEAVALALFRFQAAHNPIYALYLQYLGVKPNNIEQLIKIPFMPIEFFKYHQIITTEISPTHTQHTHTHTQQASQPTIFESSGTTGQQASRHYVLDLPFYLQMAEQIFERQYGKLENYHILALLPSYLERQTSSLVYMVQHFIGKAAPESGFYLYNHALLAEKLALLQQSNKKVLLIGVTFALLDFAEAYSLPLPNTIIMETGGMKGRRKELLRQEVHEILCKAFQTTAIHSEYGMTELLSQAYSKGQGIFEFSKTLKILLRNLNDPFDLSLDAKSGGINVIDLANVESCAFIETKDIGSIDQTNNTFQVLGRYDNSDIRGCNLMVS